MSLPKLLSPKAELSNFDGQSTVAILYNVVYIPQKLFYTLCQPIPMVVMPGMSLSTSISTGETQIKNPNNG